MPSSPRQKYLPPPLLLYIATSKCDPINHTFSIMIHRGSERETSVIWLIAVIRFTEPVPLILDYSDGRDSQLAILSWSAANTSSQTPNESLTYSLTVTSTNTQHQFFQTQESHYIFTAPEDAPPCEVYNFSVTATYVGATYTGDGCSVPSQVLSRMLPSLPDISRPESSQNFSLQKQSGGVTLSVYFQVHTWPAYLLSMGKYFEIFSVQCWKAGSSIGMTLQCSSKGPSLHKSTR